MSRGEHRGASGQAVASLPPEPPTDPDSHPVLGRKQPTHRPPPRGELVVRNGPVAGLRFVLRDGVVTVGRSSQCDCPLHDEAVSRRHFELEVTPEGVRLRDLGSGNGTRVNGQAVDQARLRHGDRIVAGNSVIEFREAVAASAVRAEPAAAPHRRRRWVRALAAGLLLVAAIALGALAARQRLQARTAAAQHLFERGRTELDQEPPDPDLALADLLAAQRDHPDRRALRDALAEARAVAAAVQQLALARQLEEQKSFEEARRQLQGLPETPYFARMRDAIAGEISQREAAQSAAARATIPIIRTLPASDTPARGPHANRGRSATKATPNDDRAGALCDEADALLGPNPAAAHQKYEEALRYAHPRSTAARRAEAGLQ